MAINFLKKIFCKHKYITITNLYQHKIIYEKNKIIRSIQICKKCGKTKKLTYLDNRCKIINYDIYYNKGSFKIICK